MAGDSRTSRPEDVHPNKSLYKNQPLISSIIAYSVFTLHDTAYSEVINKCNMIYLLLNLAQKNE
jgi:hypothetical protein